MREISRHLFLSLPFLLLAAGCPMPGGSTDCVPSTCETLGAECGRPADGCGGALDCGGCAGDLGCGVGGNPYVCEAFPVADAHCGNGVIEGDEACDGANLGGRSCQSEGFTDGLLRCTDACRLDTSGCSTCGNDVAEGDQVCDGDDVRGVTCADVFGEGHLGHVGCSPDCAALDLSGCFYDPELPATASCDPSADACASPTECVTVSTGSYCLVPCEAGQADDCDDGEACVPVPSGSGGDDVHVCVTQPDLGQLCLDTLPCAEGECRTAFAGSHGEVAICAHTCPSDAAFTGRATCAGGEACVVPPANVIERQDGDVACNPFGDSSECDTVEGYRCIDTAGDGPLCARRQALCATPVAFFGFDSTLPPEETLCDLSIVSAGGPRLCGFDDAEPIERPAAVACFPLFETVPDIGVCVAVCDGLAADDAAGELSCGAGRACEVPSYPQLFYPQPGPVACPDGDSSACDAGHPHCVNLGGGEVCARAARVCVPEDDQ
jgi:hypothetical protein